HHTTLPSFPTRRSSDLIDKHMPMVARKFGAAAKGVSVEQGLAGGTPGSPPSFVAIAHFTFESVEAFQAAFAPHAAEIMADISKRSEEHTSELQSRFDLV